MKIVQFLRDFFGDKTEINITEKIDSECTVLAVKAFSIEMAINLISGLIAKSEFRTFINNKETKGNEYYLWNVAPNRNQNSTEFIDKLVHKLLLENEVLIVQSNDGQLLIADSYNHEEFALYDDKFTSVTVKDYTFNRIFYMSDVIYIKLHDNNMTAILNDLANGYTELMNMAIDKYKREGGRKGTIILDTIKKGDEQEQKRIKKLFENDFKEYFKAENAVLPLHKGEEYTEQNSSGNQKTTSGMQNIIALLDRELESVARAYKIPPAILKGNIADVEQSTNNLLTFCIDPLVNLIQTAINKAKYGKDVLKGSYILIDTTSIKHIDVFSIADKIDKLISDGIYSIDEIRAKIKDTVIGEEFSMKHYITKNYTDINKLDVLEGGDNGE